MKSVSNLVLATATDSYMTPKTGYFDTSYRFLGVLKFGADIKFGTGRKAPKGHNVGSSKSALEKKFKKLLGEFAANDKGKKAETLFNSFLTPYKRVMIYEEKNFNAAVSAHANIDYFCRAAINAPSLAGYKSGKKRVHQQLKAAGWDITKAVAIHDLGVPALNLGSKVWGTGDFGNGLGVMVNGIQRAFVVATGYEYDASKSQYEIALTYLFYDVFGLDDDDLEEYGAESDGWFSTTAGVGITAWWQLQHQHGYAPLITRMVVKRTYTIRTS